MELSAKLLCSVSDESFDTIQKENVPSPTWTLIPLHKVLQCLTWSYQSRDAIVCVCVGISCLSISDDVLCYVIHGSCSSLSTLSKIGKTSFYRCLCIYLENDKISLNLTFLIANSRLLGSVTLRRIFLSPTLPKS